MKTKNLPQFPDFTLLQAHHQAEIDNIIKANHLYSDYNFISLWSWDHQQQLQLCVLRGNLVIKFQDYLDPSDYFYSFIGIHEVDRTAKTLLLQSAAEAKTQLKLIPQFVVENLKHPKDFVITEDRDSFDYIIAVNDSIDLKGHHESKKRSLRKLEREHGHKLTVQELDINHQETPAQIIDLFEKWAVTSNNTQEHKDNELKAIKKLLDNRHLINTDRLHVLGIFMDGQLSAFSINEVLRDGFAMGHFKKSLRDYKGLGVALDNHTARSLAKRGVSHINHEQDMGIEGLRQAKMSSNPVYFMKKYTIALPAPLEVKSTRQAVSSLANFANA